MYPANIVGNIYKINHVENDRKCACVTGVRGGGGATETREHKHQHFHPSFSKGRKHYPLHTPYSYTFKDLKRCF